MYAVQTTSVSLSHSFRKSFCARFRCPPDSSWMPCVPKSCARGDELRVDNVGESADAGACALAMIFGRYVIGAVCGERFYFWLAMTGENFYAFAVYVVRASGFYLSLDRVEPLCVRVRSRIAFRAPRYAQAGRAVCARLRRSDRRRPFLDEPCAVRIGADLSAQPVRLRA